MPPRRSIVTAERDAKAAHMRAQGATYRDIARHFGIDVRAAHNGVQRAMLDAVREPAEEVRAIELARLDQLLLHAWAVLERRHVTVSNGEVVHLDGEPLRDDGPVLAAIDRILKIQDRRAKYLGLDAPTRHEHVTLDAVDSEIIRLTRELGGRDALDVARTETGTPAPAP